MTLRVILEIVPQGVEEAKEEIFRLEINNIKTIRDRGFGHVECEYEALLFRKNNLTIQRLTGGVEYTLENSKNGIVHNRRDGALVLVAKAIGELEGLDVEERYNLPEIVGDVTKD